MELMQIMMSKVKQTEKRCAIFEKESREKVIQKVKLTETLFKQTFEADNFIKDKKIQILEEKLSLYQQGQCCTISQKSITQTCVVKKLKILFLSK